MVDGDSEPKGEGELEGEAEQPEGDDSANGGRLRVDAMHSQLIVDSSAATELSDESFDGDVSSNLPQRSYSEDEIKSIYELARFSIENGHLRRAEALAQGLTEVAPDFPPAWLCLSYIHIMRRDIDHAVFCARQALRIDPAFTEATLYLTSCMLTTGDYQTAGTLLGEVADRIEMGTLHDANLLRFYRAQLLRFQNRDRS